MLSQAVPVMQSQGTVLETQWPYNFAEIPNNSAQDPPPAGVAQDPRFKFSRVGVETGANAQNGTLIAYAMGQNTLPALFSFIVPPAGLPENGVVTTPPGAPKTTTGHCVLFTGYDDPSQIFMFKNSWSRAWGDAGYGTMTVDFVRNYGMEAALAVR